LCIKLNTMASEYRKLLNYKIYCYFNNRKLKDRDSYIFSIKKLEAYCKIPIYTIQHLLNLRRLMTDENCEKVSLVLKEEFGFDPKKKLSKEDLENKELFYIFKI
jgi:hypothetical protein